MNPFEENLEYLREEMVREQLEARDIKDKKVLDVFRKVPRHKFVKTAGHEDAYGDFPLSIGKNQTISQPYIVALMVQLLDVAKTDKVLEIGTGSGYETAILAELADTVFSIERIEELGKGARGVLEGLFYRNIRIKIDDGTLGWQEFSPFNKIIITAASPIVPRPLLDQLCNGGKIVIPTGSRLTQRMFVIEKDKKGDTVERDICGCVFVPLVGRFGWKEA